MEEIKKLVSDMQALRNAGTDMPVYADFSTYFFSSEYSQTAFNYDILHYTVGPGPYSGYICKINDIKAAAKFIYQFYPELRTSEFTPLFFIDDNIVYRNHRNGTTKTVGIYSEKLFDKDRNLYKNSGALDAHYKDIVTSGKYFDENCFFIMNSQLVYTLFTVLALTGCAAAVSILLGAVSIPFFVIFTLLTKSSLVA